MKLRYLLLCTMAAAVLSLSPAFGAETAKTKPAEKSKQAAGETFKGEWGVMAAELKNAGCPLTEAQEKELKEKIAAKETAMALWGAKGEKGVKLAEAQKALEEANKAPEKDKTKIAELKKLVEDMKAQKAAADADATKAIMGVLTAQQKDAWDAFRLFRAITGAFKKIDLTDAQKAKVRTMAAAVSKDWAKAEKGEKEKTIFNKLKADVEAQVLTAEQREALKAAAAKSESKPKTDGKETPQAK